MPTLIDYLTLSAILFVIGLAGTLTRRNVIIVLIGLEMMLNAANINFVAFARFLPSAQSGQIFAIFSIAIAGAEAAVGLALVIAVYRHYRSVNIENINTLKG
jgi:NADH:ubiquinone oxidoreductase subunit K